MWSTCSQGATLHVTLRYRLVVCPWQHPPPPPKHDFWAAQAILSNFDFEKKNLNFSSSFLFSLFRHFWMFHSILSGSKHSKFFSPQICFHPAKTDFSQAVGEARRDTMLPSILVCLLCFSRGWRGGEGRHSNRRRRAVNGHPSQTRRCTMKRRLRSKLCDTRNELLNWSPLFSWSFVHVISFFSFLSISASIKTGVTVGLHTPQKHRLVIRN